MDRIRVTKLSDGNFEIHIPNVGTFTLAHWECEDLREALASV